MNKFTDLATEFGLSLMKTDGAVKQVEKFDGIQVTTMDLTNPSLADSLGRRCGMYYTVELLDKSGDIVAHLASIIKRFDIDYSKVLIIGLGNPTYEADSLGAYVIDNLKVSEGKLLKFLPMTSAKTGIESNDIIKAVVDKVKPTAVIAIDSLATLTPQRIGVCYQLTSAGLVPGSGVGNDRKLLDKGSLGVDVLAIGVPFVCDMRRWATRVKKIPNMVVTPSNIDTIVCDAAKNIARSITIALQG